ncbi:hypothetical protein BH11PAT2_BH11PAT2_09820 [soil metagenome]
MTKDTEGVQEEALSFLVNHDAGVLATASLQGQPSARTVYYTCDDSFNVYFMTLRATRKAAQLVSNQHAAFVVSEMVIPRTLQIEGLVSDVSDTAVNDALLSDFMKRLMSHTPYGIPLEHFDSSVLAFFKLSPTWIRWGDFTFAVGTDSVFTELPATTS